MFLTKYKLLEHQSLVHTGEAHFPCPICGETFLTTARRALHKKTHNQNTIDYSIIWIMQPFENIFIYFYSIYSTEKN